MKKTIWIVRDWMGESVDAYTDVTEALSNIYDNVFDKAYEEYLTTETYFDIDDSYRYIKEAIAQFGVKKVISDLWAAADGYILEPIELLED